MSARFHDRVFLHVDMDAFYASVELLDRPELRERPVAVGADSNRSVISSANYIARRRGVRSAMPVSRAKQLCPELVLFDVDMPRYQSVSRQVMAILEEFTPLVEPLSIDEAFLDVTGARRLLGEPVEIAEAIRARILDRTALECSVGIAASKFVAKLASQRAKPNGVLEIVDAQTIDFLHSLPVSEMWGVGAATLQKLQAMAIHTVKDLAETPAHVLSKRLGHAAGEQLHRLANGIDNRDVVVEREIKSVSNERTLDADVSDPDELKRRLRGLADQVAARLRRKQLKARTVSVKVKYADFSMHTRRITVADATDSSERIYRLAVDLFDELWAEHGSDRAPSVRLVGVSTEHFSGDDEPLKLFVDVAEGDASAVDLARDSIREKFPDAAPQRASQLRPKPHARPKPDPYPGG